jgi:sec-independent protein translocase protein TatB
VFENIGWAEILVLIVAGLFILGPERLPEAARWLGSAVKKVRDYATGARDHLKNELGSDFDQLQQPLNDLRGLRDFNPKRAITRTLFPDEDEPLKPNGYAPTANGSPASVTPPAANGSPAPTAAPTPAPASEAPLSLNERPPIDPDAT